MPQKTHPATERDRALARHLGARHWIVDRSTLVALGFGVDHGNRQVAAGRWQRVHRGVYCGYTGPLTFLSRCEAALRAVGHAAMLDGAAALHLQSRRKVEFEGPIEVAIPHGETRRQVRGVRIRQTDALTSRSWWTRQGMPVLRPEWAAVTVARRSPMRARATLTEVVQRGVVLPAHLVAVLLASGAFRGRPRLMTHLADIDGARARSSKLSSSLCAAAPASSRPAATLPC